MPCVICAHKAAGLTTNPGFTQRETEEKRLIPLSTRIDHGGEEWGGGKLSLLISFGLNFSVVSSLISVS